MELAYQRSSERGEKTWTRHRIGEEGLDITRRAGATLRVDRCGDTRDDEMVEHIATLLPHGTGDLRSAVLLLPSNTAFTGHGDVLLVNGLPPLTVTELADRAEISLGTESLFYRKAGSTALEIFDSIEDEDCVRCKRRIAQGAAIRRCSACGSAHHEGATTDPELGDLWCAGYDPKCGRCGGLWDTTPASEDAQHDG